MEWIRTPWPVFGRNFDSTNKLIVVATTVLPYSETNGSTSVPPPAKLILSGTRQVIFFTVANCNNIVVFPLLKRTIYLINI